MTENFKLTEFLISVSQFPDISLGPANRRQGNVFLYFPDLWQRDRGESRKRRGEVKEHETNPEEERH